MEVMEEDLTEPELELYTPTNSICPLSVFFHLETLGSLCLCF